MDSSGAVSFFIYLLSFPIANYVKSDFVENSKTSERLVITGIDNPFRPVTIARHPMQANVE
jgi:hypothetical protein